MNERREKKFVRWLRCVYSTREKVIHCEVKFSKWSVTVDKRNEHVVRWKRKSLAATSLRNRKNCVGKVKETKRNYRRSYRRFCNQSHRSKNFNGKIISNTFSFLKRWFFFIKVNDTNASNVNDMLNVAMGPKCQMNDSTSLLLFECILLAIRNVLIFFFLSFGWFNAPIQWQSERSISHLHRRAIYRLLRKYE